MQKDSEKMLRGAGLRATTQRVAILTELLRVHRPLSIKDIGSRFPKIDTVTLYRMMETFTAKGLVSRLDLGSAHVLFEAKEDDHHHIVCVNCKTVEDFRDNSHEKEQKKILARSRSFAKIVNHSYELFGLCNVCFKTKSVTA